jgi:putative ABC transport system substrate-binding protein
MRRRHFAAGLLLWLAAPLAAAAQQPSKVFKIGYLGAFSSQSGQPLLKSFLQGFNDLGYVEGRDFVMEYRWADGHADRLPELAADLVRAQVDVMVAGGTPATMAAKQATQTIPIVFPVLAGAVERGIVDSLARPGGNVTGLTTQTSPLKLYQLLKEAAPTVERVAYLYDPGSGGRGGAERQQATAARAQALNVKWQPIAMRDPPGVVQAFAQFERGTNGLVLDFSTLLLLNADQVCRLALQRRLPTVGYVRQFVDAGCLMSYGENLADMHRRAAQLVDKILKGAKPADLPVEQPTKFDLVINLKTAKALGLTIPPALLLLANQVIE